MVTLATELILREATMRSDDEVKEDILGKARKRRRVKVDWV